MIPKVIHYCWFGGAEKPAIVQRCINSWKKNLTDYEIIEWNEENFDIEAHPFTKAAYEIGNYAFVSDYVRVYALYHQGGIYLDTDTEIYQSLNPFLNEDSFWGFEEKNFIATSLIGAKPFNPLIKEFLEFYDTVELINKDGIVKKFTNVLVVTELLQKRGIVLDGTRQTVDDIATIYPQEYFSPYDYINCYMKKTSNTVAIHHFHKSWLPFSMRIKGTLKKIMSYIIGGKNMEKIRTIIEKRGEG
ncbi:MAG: glycosyl transferase [Turicibacter sp.]|nr:glycosyl transferase [Turicibacter sp.]